ncbi:uncharacterized protein N0V89_010857 [Didymosphaeria variabile]|uniref:Lysine-specific metallo-endopeptidase domain-containing protein n=1 Tax=Didymosphaeria variabile TaxID=1932322 RepID=A0A9W9C6K5_9PLEO|nr:uncharacterized protein N0V89_010857 [Didymosphaeria variabile]KAJ4346924.1 hypothetical protein N0V89_010857 [Didymosphaeria variabile]
MLSVNWDLLVAGLLLLTGVQALPATDFDTSLHSLSKRAVTWDANCNKKYGTNTAKEWLQKSWNTIEPLSQAGHDGLENVVKLIEFKAGISTVDPKLSETEQLRLVPLYQIMFGEIEKDAATETLDKADVAKHVTRAKVVMESLKRLEAIGKNRRPNLSMHCDDDFLQTKDLKNKPYSGPAASTGKVWRFNTDTKAWEQYTNNGRVCVGQNAGVTFIKKAGQITAETMVICPAYFEIQATLEKKDQLHLWELNRDSLPEKYWNMGEDKTDDFHMAAFGRKIGMKLFHEMMHTSFFHPTRNYFKDQLLTTGLKTGQKAYTFVGAAQLASENKDLAAKNIDNVVYWSIANYFERYHWETGYARLPGAESPKEPAKRAESWQVRGEEES